MAEKTVPILARTIDKIRALIKHMPGEPAPGDPPLEAIVDGITVTLEQRRRLINDLLREKDERDRDPKEKAIQNLEEISMGAKSAGDYTSALGAQKEIDVILGILPSDVTLRSSSERTVRRPR